MFINSLNQSSWAILGIEEMAAFNMIKVPLLYTLRGDDHTVVAKLNRPASLYDFSKVAKVKLQLAAKPVSH